MRDQSVYPLCGLIEFTPIKKHILKLVYVIYLSHCVVSYEKNIWNDSTNSSVLFNHSINIIKSYLHNFLNDIKQVHCMFMILFD